MALDAQSNWNVEMSQPMRVALRPRTSAKNVSTTKTPSSAQTLSSPLKASTREVPLPTEIISLILSFIPRRASSQPTFWACTLVSRAWYSAAIARLYDHPHLTPGNFSFFVSTICPSKNAHIRHTPLSVLVHRLDMSELVHNSSRSLTARLLGRLKGNLEEFVAPQTSFAINSFAALSKCVRLRYLDLSLVPASIEMEQLFNTLSTMNDLETLFFPRSSRPGVTPWTEGAEIEKGARYTWPPRLKALHLAGGVDNYFLKWQLIHAPKTLERLSIQHCSQAYVGGLMDCLEVLGPQLQHLTIRHPMTKLFPSALDHILLLCPSLIAFRVSADYISHSFFESIPQSHPLRILELDCSSTAGVEVGIDPDTIFDAVEEGRLPDLRSVRVHARLAWTATERIKRDAQDLGDILEAAERERPLGVVAGVWIVNDEMA